MLPSSSGGGYGPPAPLPGDSRETASLGEDEAAGPEDEAIAFVYVPTRPYESVTQGEAQPVRFELRRLPDGSPGLAVFTERQRLVNTLGIHQPYVKVGVLDLLVQVAGEKISVVVNPALEHGAPQWSKEAVQDWRRSNK